MSPALQAPDGNADGLPAGIRLILGADEAGVDYKNRILADLSGDPRISEIIDIGVNRSDAPEEFTRPYPYVGIAAGEMIRDGRADRAILFCGTGIGVAIAANKVPGIRACMCHDSFSARQGVEDDDMNVLCLGARIVGEELAAELLRDFLGAQFSGAERHQRRLDKVKAMEGRVVP